MTSSLQDMNERMAQWMAEKPTFDSGAELRLEKDDLVLFQFVSSGEDGDQFIKVYRSHILEAISKAGKRYNTHRYCPVQSGDDMACPLCDQGVKDIKERMSIWMYVTNILHAKLPQDKQFPYVAYEGKNYYQEEVNGWKVWHTSAWRDSPWQMIVKLGAMYKGLHNFAAQLIAVGDGLNRRFSVYAIPQTEGITAEQYTTAKVECENLGDMLRKQINQAVQLNPNPGQQVQGQPQQQPVPFVPGGQAQPQPVPFQPAQVMSNNSAPFETGEPQPIEVPPSQPEADNRRPLKSLF